jgi:hypothetical protein
MTAKRANSEYSFKFWLGQCQASNSGNSVILKILVQTKNVVQTKKIRLIVEAAFLGSFQRLGIEG